MHDEWGRALTDGRHEDLVGFSAELNGDRIEVTTNGVSRVPGRPYFDGAAAIESFRPPTFRRAGSLDPGPGWWELDTNVVTAAGEARVCGNAEPIPCPSDAPLLPDTGVSLPDDAPVYWNEGPVVVHVNAAGVIDEFAVLGGSGRSAG